MLLIRLRAAVLLACVVSFPAYGQQRHAISPPCQTDSGDLVSLLACAKDAAAEARYEDAIEGFEAVLKSGTDTTPELRARATSGLVNARIALRKKSEGLSGRLLGFLQKYLVPLVVLLAVLLFRTLANIFPRSGTVISFSDLDAEPGAAPASSRALTAELLFMLEDPEPVAVRGLHMNTMPGTGQPAFGVVRPAQAMTQASDFSPSEHPMKLAGVELSLGDAFRIVRLFFGRPNEGNLIGWLSCGEGSAAAGAELSRRGYRRGAGPRHGPWRATATGECAREEALANIAAQILVDRRENRFTDSWQSLKACQDGIRVLRQAGGGIFDSAKARRYFETALEHDSGNWIARFYVAISLCSEDEGRPATALRHFQILDEVLTRVVQDEAFHDRVETELARGRTRKAFLGLRARIRAYFRNRRDRGSPSRTPRLTGLLEHLIRYPECPFILQYNIAIALEELHQNSGPQESLSSFGEDVTWKDPLKSLETIAALRDATAPAAEKYSLCAALLEERERLELALYAQSARAHIMSMHDAPRHVGDLREILKSMEVTCKDLRCLDRRIESWKALETTRAVALVSLARARAAIEDLKADQEARNLLYEAIACEPHLIDAYLQLAKLYMRRKDQFAKDWSRRAESLLNRADEMNPTCGTKTLLAELGLMVNGSEENLANEAARA